MKHERSKKAKITAPLSAEEISARIRGMLAAKECEIEEGNNDVVFKLKTTKTGHNKGKSVTVDYINNIIKKSGFVLKEEDDSKNTYVLPPEKKYVRRTADDFKAGAEPVRAGGSHRLSTLKVTTTEELERAVKDAADAAGVKFTLWARAAFRKALREGVDVDYELDTALELTTSKPEGPSQK